MTDVNEFRKKYDYCQDGVEDKIMEFFKQYHFEYYAEAIRIHQEAHGDGSIEPSPGELLDAFSEADKEELFFEIVKNWFHATVPEDYK